MAPRQKVQVWIYSKEQEVLLFRMTAERGGGWQPVTGGVEKEESLVQAALREVSEESGIHAQEAESLQIDFKFKDRWGDAHEFVFAVQAPSPLPEIKLDPKEHSEYQWITPKKAMSLLKYPIYQEALFTLAKRWTLERK